MVKFLQVPDSFKVPGNKFQKLDICHVNIQYSTVILNLYLS